MAAIPTTMKALIARAPGEYGLEQVNVPVPGEGEILIKTEACGICAGDLKAYHGAARFWGGENMPEYIIPPMIPGHEFIGEIVAMGKNVRGDFALGDRVVSEQIVPCGECRFCRTGRHWMCQPHDVYGFKSHVNGGMAEYVLLPKTSLNYRVPKDIPTKSAVLIEPFACSKHAVDRAQITNEDVVVLAGAGTLGLGMVGAIAMKSPKTFIVLDMKADRLELAKQYGADIVLNPAKDDVESTVMSLTGGYGCDIYVEATGHPSAVQQGLDLLRKLGRFVEFSVFSAPATVDWSIISDTKELDVLGAHLSPYCYEPVIEWIGDGLLPTQGVVTHEYALDDWEEAFAVAEKGDGAIKVIFRYEE